MMDKLRIDTDNRYMDNIIRCLKILLLESILKDTDLADNNETISSIRNSDLYMGAIENLNKFDMFTSIPTEVLEKSYVPNDIIQSSKYNLESIPMEYRNIIVKNMNEYIIDNYIELNNYYRNLNGLPDVDDPGIRLEHNVLDVDITKYIHQMNEDEIHILENTGELETLILENPTKTYLQHLGLKKIPIYYARKTYNFGLLYTPEIEYEKLAIRFKELVEKNRVYALKVIYSDAFKYNSDYYDNFIQLFIKIQAIIDIINDLPESVIRRDFFDNESIRDMFLSHGIHYYPEIPYRYQIAMIKNLNSLLKYKSTTRNIIDICNIFGFDNIQIFKYYLLKDRRMIYSGEYTEPKYIEDEDGNLIEDYDKNYKLKFVKVPVNDIADNYIRDTDNHLEYDEVVYYDEFWDAEYDHQEVKEKILEHEFNYVLSKYLSIDTIYDMSQLSFDLAYLFNMIFDNKHLEEYLVLPINKIKYNRKFKLTDAICFLYVLTYESIGIEDTILDTTGKVLYVKGFNFQVDLSEIGTYILNKGYTLEEFGIADMTIPKSNIMTYNNLLNIYIKNRNIYRHVVKQLCTVDDINIYRIYQKIYKALLISQLNTSSFINNSGNFCPTYTEYLKDRDNLLYETIQSIRSLEGEEKNIRISELLDDVINSLEECLQTDKLDFKYISLSAITNELIKKYIYKIINFFKSYTVQLLSMNVIYKFDDQSTNKVIMIDDHKRYGVYTFDESSTHHRGDSIMFSKKYVKYDEYMKIKDRIFILRTYS